LLDNDIPEAYVFEFAYKLVDFAEGIDDPACTELAEYVFLRTTQFTAAKKAVGDNDPASRAQETI